MSLIKKLREPVSGLTHLFGVLLSIIGLILLVIQSVHSGNATQIIAFSIYGVSLVLLYLASSLYHLLPVSQKAILRLKKFDHMMIYILIAGTFTPFTLIALRGEMKWGLFTTIWVLAFIGIIVKLLWINVPRWLSTGFYLGMGWLGIVMFPSLIHHFSINGIYWIALGGLFYTVGAVIYAIKKPNPFPKTFGFHEIWHIFVLLGSFCHFWSIYVYLGPLK